MLNAEERTWGYRAEYDRRGRMTRETMLDAQGQVAVTPVGWARADIVWDAWGHNAEEAYFDAQGKPIGGGKPAKLTFEYDSHHRERARRYSDSSADPVPGPDGFASLLTDYDEVGHLIAERCLDPAGNPVARKTGNWATHRIDWSGGRRVEHWFNAAGREIPAPK